MNQPIRVFVVDDSALMRRRLCSIVEATPGYQVAGYATDGNDCLARLATVRPDVVTLDVEMPGLDGLSTLQRIMRECPTPVIMISTLTEAGAKTTIDALALGAVDYLAKPTALTEDDRARFSAELLAKLAVAARARLSPVARPRAAISRPALTPAPVQPWAARPAVGHRLPLVVIGSSTGGPQALDHVFDHLDQGLGAALLIVQHMPPIFTRSLAARLARRSSLDVREAAEGDHLSEQTALVAPGGWHMTIDKGTRIRLDQTPPVHGVRPAVDRTLLSIADHWQGPCLAVILTGMGVDGADGVRAVRAKGADVLAQDEETSVVFGMPRAVIDAGLASAILPIEQMGAAIQHWVQSAAARAVSLTERTAT
jgi:two-component system chemotaxis response regulator CheB